jgi:hypothetical protein
MIATSVTTVITYVITEDGPDGQPWRPDGDDPWCVVTRTHGFTDLPRFGEVRSILEALTADGGAK